MIPRESFSAPKQLFSHAHPSSQIQDGTTATPHEQHVLLPFNLQDLSINIYEGEPRDLLYHIFPDTLNVSEARYRSHLIFQVKKLPEPPWPLTVGGVPFTISTLSSHDYGRALIFPRQILGNGGISICEHEKELVEFSDKELRNFGANVHSWFRENLPEIRIIELMVTCERLIYIVLEDHVHISSSLIITLPGNIARYGTGYINNRELHRPGWTDLQAKRLINPQPKQGIIDNTMYDILRPGVLLSSKILKEHGHPAVFSTTSGVLVQNKSGDRFMTAASHGIADDRYVWQGDHCHHDGSIGQAILEIAFTDISLVKLNDDVTFVNETFESISGVSPSFSRLSTSEDKFAFTHCFLNSPYTGNMVAKIVAKGIRFESSTHPTEDKLRYVVYNWSYMGQTEGNEDRVRPPDGTCGSAIWDDNGVITGLYHYYIEKGPWSGFSASVSASELVEAGYTLCGP